MQISTFRANQRTWKSFLDRSIPLTNGRTPSVSAAIFRVTASIYQFRIDDLKDALIQPSLLRMPFSRHQEYLSTMQMIPPSYLQDKICFDAC